MHTGLKIAALLLLLATSGCRSRGELDLAERDMRLQENRIYKLQDYVQQYQMMLEECEAENAELKKQLAAQGGVPNSSGSSRSRTLGDMLRGDSRKPSAGDPGGTGPNFSIPVTPDIDLGTEFNPSQTPPAKVPSTTPMRSEKPVEEDPPGDAPSIVPDFAPEEPSGSAELPAPDELPEPSELPEPDSARSGSAGQATDLAIRAIGQVNGSNSATGEGGLLVVVEPRSLEGGIARAPEGATMSLMLVTSVGENVLGRWDYDAEKTSNAYRGGFGGANSWRFVLPMMIDTSTSTKLKLYVRMVTPDGTKLLSDREFDTSSGASVEELPAGNANWSRSNRPLAAISEFLGRELRTASRGINTASRGFSTATQNGTPRGSNSSNRNRSGGGNHAPAWQPQEMKPPAVSTGSTSTSTSSLSPAGTGNVARRWDTTELPAKPLATQPIPSANPAPAAETANKSGRPTWSPYR